MGKIYIPQKTHGRAIDALLTVTVFRTKMTTELKELSVPIVLV